MRVRIHGLVALRTQNRMGERLLHGNPAMTGNAQVGRDVENRAAPNECADAHIHAAQQSIGIWKNKLVSV
jgi:hypothetical protein